MTKKDPMAWPRYVAPAVMLTNGMIVATKPVKFMSYDDKDAERKMPLHGDALKDRKIKGRKITQKDISAIGYFVDGDWMEAVNRGMTSVGGMMFQRDRALRKSSGPEAGPQKTSDWGGGGGFDPKAPMKGVTGGFDPKAPMGGGGDVQVDAYEREGHQVQSYTRSRPNR